jgi:hypothetical protein
VSDFDCTSSANVTRKCESVSSIFCAFEINVPYDLIGNGP